MNEPTQLPARITDSPLLPTEFTAFGSIAHFTDAQRMAKALLSSSIVPEAYRGEQHLGDCLIALEIANRIGANVLAVMQNLYIVHGKPAWSSQFLIACVNASRRFTPLRYVMTGEKGTDSYGCIAWAQDKTGERLESPEITIGTAKAEGWFQKNGSKWKTMPELMLRYRVATLFARLYAPELTMGIQSADEVEDIIDITPIVTDPGPPKSLGDTTKKVRFVKPAAPQPAPVPESEPEPEPKPGEGVPEQPPASMTGIVDNPELAALTQLLTKEGVTPEQMIAFSVHKKFTVAETLEATDKRNLKNLAKALGSPNSTLLKELKAFIEPPTP